MSAKPPTLKGVVRGGVVVVETPCPLPDGTEVEVTVTRHVFTPDERAEFEGWEKASDEAFQMIHDLEQQDRDARR